MSHGEIELGAAGSEQSGRSAHRPRSGSLQGIVPWLVLLLGWAATAWLTVSLRREMKARDGERFYHETEQVVGAVETRLRSYAQALMGLRDRYFVYQTNMTSVFWQGSVDTLHIPAHYPGWYDVGFVESVVDFNAPREYPAREDHLQRMRVMIGPEYRFHLPPGGIPSWSWYHMPVVWHSYAQWRRDPVREYTHYGMDFNQNPDLWSAMNWALGDDRPGFSGRQLLDPDRPEIRGLFLFAPVYRNPLPWRNGLSPVYDQASHLSALRGLVFGSIDIGAFLRHQLGTNPPVVAFSLHASTNQPAYEGAEQLLFDNRERADGARSGYAVGSTRRELPLYGRTLTFNFEPGPSFVSALNERTLWYTAAFGGTTTLLLAGFIEYQARANRKERDASQALRESESRLQALMREREESSRDLHDGVLQSLYALGLGLQKTRRVLQREPPRAEEHCRENVEALELVMEELRRHLGQGARGPRPELDLFAALECLVSASNRNGNAPVRLELEGDDLRSLTREQAFQMLQIVREALANAERHSRASRIVVRAQRLSAALELRVEDDGIGFDVTKTDRQGHGLRNMTARAEELGIELILDSRPGGGTRVVVRAPLPGDRAPGPGGDAIA